VKILSGDQHSSGGPPDFQLELGFKRVTFRSRTRGPSPSNTLLA
jgi:hypothetical protein